MDPASDWPGMMNDESAGKDTFMDSASPRRKPVSGQGRRTSAFDYTITISRKYRYLVVSAPELGPSVASAVLDLDSLSPERLGNAALRIFSSIHLHLDDLEKKRIPAPPPWQARTFNPVACKRLRVSAAARVLGVSIVELRELVRAGSISADRSPGGQLRFSLETLLNWMVSKGHREEKAS